MIRKSGMCSESEEGKESSMQSSEIRGTVRHESDSYENEEFVVTLFDREDQPDPVQVYDA
jgi:hypothetical protein